MIKTLKFSELAQRFQLRHRDELEFSALNTDSRTLKPGEVFVALVGERFDGHDYLAKAQSLGASGCIINDDRLDQVSNSINLPLLIGDDTLKVYGLIARENRRAFKCPVVAITGSCGKTTVKEMISAILAEQGQVHKTEKNFNNQIGVPRTLLGIDTDDDFAVIEIGTSEKGEILKNVTWVEPDVALINNANAVHLEGLGSLENIVQEKGDIIEGVCADGTVVLNFDDPYFSVWSARARGRRVLSFSLSNPQADLYASNISLSNNGISCQINSNIFDRSGKFSLTLALLGRHNLANALAASTCALTVGATFETIVAGLNQLRPVDGRMALIPLPQGSLIIDDTYNGNPASMRMAIDALKEFPGRKILVMGEMAELGADAERAHGEIGEYAALAEIDIVMTVGELTGDTVDQFNAVAHRRGQHQIAIFFDNQTDLCESVADTMQNSTILIKGSRSAKMEKVVQFLTSRE